MPPMGLLSSSLQSLLSMVFCWRPWSRGGSALSLRLWCGHFFLFLELNSPAGFGLGAVPPTRTPRSGPQAPVPPGQGWCFSSCSNSGSSVKPPQTPTPVCSDGCGWIYDCLATLSETSVFSPQWCAWRARRCLLFFTLRARARGLPEAAAFALRTLSSALTSPRGAPGPQALDRSPGSRGAPWRAALDGSPPFAPAVGRQKAKRVEGLWADGSAWERLGAGRGGAGRRPRPAAAALPRLRPAPDLLCEVCSVAGCPFPHWIGAGEFLKNLLLLFFHYFIRN